MDTGTGEIRAIGGNRYKNIKRGRNFATTLTERSPGSTIKPILDYGPAIEYLNWSTYEQLVDEPYKYSTGDPINNFDNRHLGQMSIREALYRSRNIPALKAFEAVGQEKAKEFAANIGMEFDKVFDSASIGGIENVSPLKLAGAYATFGNNGIYNEPHTVKKIILRDGVTEVSNKIKPKIAMKESTAYMVTSMLKDVLSYKEGSTGKSAIISGLPAAAKTGTSNYSADEKDKYNLEKGDVPDSWFAGYTTNYSLAVWTGYDNRTIPLRGSDQQIAKDLYRNLMTHVSNGIDTPDFKMPNSVVKVAVENGTNPPQKPSKYTPESNIVYELFLAGTEPKEVSAAFDRLDAPTVTGEYIQETNEIIFTWDHPETDEKHLKFDVAIKASGGEKESIGITSDLNYTMKNVEPGATYSIEVTAVSDNQRSTAGTTSVSIPIIEDDTPPDDGQEGDQGEIDNGNNNGDNGNNNGVEPPGDDGTDPEEPTEPSQGDGDSGGDGDSSEDGNN